MNAGFIAGLLMLSAVILLATGWKYQLIESGSSAYAYTFLGGLVILLFVSDGLEHSLRAIPLLWTGVWCACTLTVIAPRLKRIYTLLFALIAGLLWWWVRSSYVLDPVFMLWSPRFDAPLAAGIMIAACAARFHEQFVIVGFASALGERLLHDSAAVWGWADQFMLALAAVRCVSLAFHGLAALLAPLRSRILVEREKWEGQGGDSDS